MRQKETLTNETLTKLFSDNFELAIYAIKVAQHRIHEGVETTMKDVLSEIMKNPPHKGIRNEILQAAELRAKKRELEAEGQ